MSAADNNVAILLDRVLSRHGGITRWSGIDYLDVKFSSGGLLFLSRFVPGYLLDRTARVFPRSYRMEITSFPRPGFRGWFDGASAVGIMSDTGISIERRDNARQLFQRVRRHLWWDELDLMYFAGYALLNYLCFPFFLARNDFRLRQIKPLGNIYADSGMEVEFPCGFPTHSSFQQFYFDCEGQLIRNDYTAEVVGSWAHAAHFCYQHREFDGFLFPTYRVVHPRIAGRSLPFPTLVWIRIDDIHCFEGTT